MKKTALAMPRESWMPARLADALVVAALLSGCASVGALPGPTFDGVCPDLAGTYREEGTSTSWAGNIEVAHLSGILDLRHAGQVRMHSDAGPGRQVEYFIKTFVISHPARESASFAGYGESSRHLATMKIGLDEGWRCSQGVFVKHVVTHPATEAGTWDESRTTRLYRDSGGDLVVTEELVHQARPSLMLGGPTGLRTFRSVQRYKPVI